MNAQLRSRVDFSGISDYLPSSSTVMNCLGGAAGGAMTGAGIGLGAAVIGAIPGAIGGGILGCVTGAWQGGKSPGQTGLQQGSGYSTGQGAGYQQPVKTGMPSWAWAAIAAGGGLVLIAVWLAVTKKGSR